MKNKSYKCWAVIKKNGSLRWIDGLPCFYKSKSDGYYSAAGESDSVERVLITVRKESK